MIEPMLARPSGGIPVGPDWSYEVKWDGLRGVAVVRDGEVRLQSRSGKTDQVSQFPAIAEQLAALPDVVLDGELLRPGSQWLSPGTVVPDSGYYIVFDLLQLDGVNLRGMPLRARRQALALLLEANALPSVLLSQSFEDGDALLVTVAELGLEGVMAKRIESTYAEGRRSENWIKVKVRQEQEFIVCGWTDGKNGRAGTIGSLVLGYWELWPGGGGLELVSCGRVGARTDDEAELRSLMVARDHPTLELGSGAPLVHWIEPTVVVQVEFQKWTSDGNLWHPICKGIRTDKDARDVVRET